MRSSAFERRMLFERAGGGHLPPDAIVTSFDRATIVPNS
jgi:hypothetical protein